MPPPPVPLSNHSQNPPSQRSPMLNSNEQVPFPIRHPRPLTAAELYQEFEKEQENVVGINTISLLENAC